jgi:hypothetical protein
MILGTPQAGTQSLCGWKDPHRCTIQCGGVGGSLQCSPFGLAYVLIVTMQTGLGHCRDKLSAV